jgi:oxygen-independent coproporphyrinogen-3 oxidase
LAEAGYVLIGMDHFARPDDELAIALSEQTLQRNFQGYSTFADTNMLAFGVSSIGFVGNSYYQSAKDLDSYYNFLNADQLPILRGLLLSPDDVLRREIIQQIMCQFELNYAAVGEKYQLDFASYFAAELAELPELAEIGLITLTPSGFQVCNKGRFLIRNVAKVFDRYLRANQDNRRYSKVI